MMNTINFASSHFLTRRLCFRRLIPEDVLNLWVQLIRGLIDEFEVASFNLRSRLFAQVLSQNGFNKSRTRVLRPCHSVDAGEYVLR